MRKFRWMSAALAVLFSVVTVSAASGAVGDATASFTVEKSTEVPGGTLKPGTYKIQLLDHLSDRSVVQVDSSTGDTHLTFLGVSGGAAADGAVPHTVEWNGGQHKKALRGFVFQGGRAVEFVYPKAEAVALANANQASVVAVDPASEGRPELGKLSQEDLRLVNLWILTPVRVGPNSAQKGIDAKHYTGNSDAVAQNTPAAAPVLPATNTAAPAPAATAPPVAIAKLTRPAGIRPHQVVQAKQLPKTASDLSLVWLVAAASVGSAAWLRRRRVVATSAISAA